MVNIKQWIANFKFKHYINMTIKENPSIELKKEAQDNFLKQITGISFH